LFADTCRRVVAACIPDIAMDRILLMHRLVSTGDPILAQ